MPSRRLLRATLVAAALPGGIAGAGLAAGGACFSPGDLKDHPALALARVIGAPRTFFVEGATGKSGCPDATARCRAKAFLVPGDRVVAGPATGGFACTSFVSPRGQERTGWLPEASLAREPNEPVATADWAGTWIRDEATITITRKGEKTVVHGEATYGAHDPDRVKRGAVNVGEVDGIAAPSGPDLAFAVGTDATLPVDKGGEGACQLWLRRLGPYLVADDNLQCGGMNVTFSGTYARGR